MAIVHVSTWPDLLAAITVADNDVYLDTDINANVTIDSTITIRGDLYGQGHTIYNITYQNTDPFILSNDTQDNGVVFEDVNFANVNVLIGDKSLFVTTLSSKPWTFNRCKIQGSFKDGNIAYGHCTFNQCSFTLANKTGRIFNNANINLFECWFDIGDMIATADPAILVKEMRNCYFKGHYTVTDNNSRYFVASSPTVNYCIFNIYFEGSTTGTVRIRQNNNSVSTTCLYNTSRISVTNFEHGNIVGLSDSELKSATDVAAAGFPIVT